MFGRELDGYWKTVVNTIRDGIMIVNTNGAIVSVNEAFSRITDYCREEVIGQSCKMLNCDVCKEAMANGADHYCSLFRLGSIENRKGRIQRKDGTFVNVLKNAALLRDADGNVIGAVGTIADLTEISEKEDEINAFRMQLLAEGNFHGIVGSSPPMRRLFDMIENSAHSDAPVIIYGESGTGKELVSQAIHEIGDRKNQPFIKVNCASLSESLLESELFGHVRGAYTGAYKDRIGRFEKANEGDIFLDEIGDLPLSTQVKLLRVLEEKVIERVGSSSPITTNVRIISATNQNLPELVDKGAFRKDFYFRINVIPIFIAPLRDRVEDIPLLAESIMRKLQLKSGKKIEQISEGAMDILMNYGWPGNVRELIGAFEYAFVTCYGSVLEPRHLPQTIYAPKQPGSSPKKSGFNLGEIEKQELLDALKKTGGNQSKAAEILGVSRVTVWNRMRRFGIDARRSIEILDNDGTK